MKATCTYQFSVWYLTIGSILFVKRINKTKSSPARHDPSVENRIITSGVLAENRTTYVMTDNTPLAKRNKRNWLQS